MLRSVYIYYFGCRQLGEKQYSVDFYNLKSGKSMQYVNARGYWVERLKKLLKSAGGNNYVERKENNVHIP